MRSSNIKFTLTIPTYINKPDGNGYIYSHEAIAQMVDSMKDIPVLDENHENVLGIVEDALLDDNKNIIASGSLWHGGTSESVNISDDGMIMSAVVNSVTICT